MNIIVSVTKESRLSCGRYVIPEEEYDIFVKFMIEKTAEKLIFSTRKTTMEPDICRIWKKDLTT